MGQILSPPMIYPQVFTRNKWSQRLNKHQGKTWLGAYVASLWIRRLSNFRYGIIANHMVRLILFLAEFEHKC